MFRPLDDRGTTKFDHLKQAEAAGAVIPELKSPHVPDAAIYLWNLWTEIQNERDNSLSVQSLKVREIMGWANAFNFRLTPFEIEAIQAIDREYVDAHGHRKPKHQSNEQRPC